MSIDSLTLRLGARWLLPVLSPRTLAVAAGFAMLYLSWGSTFLANHLALQGFPALVLAGLRFCWPVPCLPCWPLPVPVARAWAGMMPGWR